MSPSSTFYDPEGTSQCHMFMAWVQGLFRGDTCCPTVTMWMLGRLNVFQQVPTGAKENREG